MSAPATPLAGRTILVLEDNFIVALALADTLRDLGLIVLGPFADLAAASAVTAPVDLALLDVNVRGGTTTALALALRQRGVGCVFVTGYSAIPDLPAELRDVPRLSKPLEPAALRRTLEQLATR